MDFNSLKMNVVITVLVLFLVFLLPWADRRICRRLRLNLEGGLSENPNADRLLRLRQRLLRLLLRHASSPAPVRHLLHC